MRLTKTQLELLGDIAGGFHACVESYKPAQKLVALGLAEFRFPGRLYPTEAGRAALASEPSHDRL